MLIKYKGEDIQIPQHMWEAMCQHANERDMTMDEYIAEAFMKLREDTVGEVL